MTNTARTPALTKVTVALALAGAVLASYLTVVHVNTDALVCGLGDCQTVQASEFATIGPVPVSLFGLGMYVSILGAMVLAWQRPDWTVAAHSAAFAVALAGAVYAVYLTWIEVEVIHAICQWCVISATLTLALTIVLGVMLWQAFTSPSVAESETEMEHAAS